ncbi:hypothetical protein [Vibrio ordalii]|uniref:hypothetical protein n=1 Tax=Vibrio ordalii TaxID=28174 RepID=UPI000373F824|nr:hypothetical protein [Vibrio ordalii]OEE75745.1 hypothetical protein A1QQ_15970 [Vibrio ordalii FF-167]
MLPKIRIRLSSGFIMLFVLVFWLYPSYLVWTDYQQLLNKSEVVRLSIISLWLPVGGLGGMLVLVWMLPPTIFYGKGMGEIYSPKSMQLANKVCIYFALAGVAFAAGWTYHSLGLLDRYGYVYSRDLTEITPTGIHLMYIKSN